MTAQARGDRFPFNAVAPAPCRLTQMAAPFTTTDALRAIQGVQQVRRSGAEAVMVELWSGQKWRLPNLYFLAWLLVNDPLTRWLVYVVGERNTRGASPGE